MAKLTVKELKEIRNTIDLICNDINKKVVGSKELVRFMTIALVSNNHVLMEGVPGLAKTLLASEFSKHMKMVFKRIQFTPDMLPSDVSGNMIFNLETRKLEFREGPVFTNILLADEINRTPSKVQSALLEAMEEKQVSIGGETRPLPVPFMVIATQNPIEQEGTFPVAEALMDRFLFRLILKYPDRKAEVDILNRKTEDSEPEVTMDVPTVVRLREQVQSVFASQQVKEYMVDIMRRTRESKKVYVGASPRTTAKLLLASKSCALVHGRAYVTPEDVYYIMKPMLNHRLILRPEAMLDENDEGSDVADKVIDEILSEVQAPK